MYGTFSNSITQGMFPNKLKLADITPAHNTGDRQDKGNYRPVGILSPISIVNEGILCNQLYNAFDDVLSQCGFREGYSTHHCLIVMLEKFKQSIDRKEYCGVLLSKAFDSLLHELLIA